MARPKAEITKQLEAISAKCGLSPKHLRTMVSDGLPLELDAALHWLNRRPGPDNDGDSAADLRRERIRLIRAQSAKAELELSIRRNEVIARDEVDEHFAKAAQAMSAMMRALETSLPPMLYGRNQMEMRGLIHSELLNTMNSFRDAESAFWKSHKPGE